MIPKVERSPLGGWIGWCEGCKETVAGHTGMVHVWADVHNDFCTARAVTERGEG